MPRALDGFGKLVKQVFNFSPGLNLIYGPNEAGKSTLQRSILAALYGFFDDGQITAGKRAVMAAYEPWDTRASFGLKLVFEVDGGSEYRVERTFAPKAETVLYDLKSGKSINSKYPSSSQGRLFFAEKLIGMPREVFENTSYVRQAELAALEKSASAITDTLLRLSASASQESTASQALELLETTLKEQIGTSRSRNKPLPEAQHHLESLRKARTNVLTEHQVLSDQMHELAQAEENYQKLQRERDKTEYQRLLAQRLVNQQQRQTIEQADAEVERCQQVVSQYKDWATFPADTQPKIQRLAVQHEKAQADALQAEKTARTALQRMTILHSQVDSLYKTLDSPRELGPLPDF
jgi:DNA repair exonuclease SbcCD ATPase subunit